MFIVFGAKSNVEKLEVFVINGRLQSISMNLPFILKSDCIDISGITLGNDKEMKLEIKDWKTLEIYYNYGNRDILCYEGKL